MNLPPPYHWSPADRHAKISRQGLRPGCKPVINTVRHRHISLATSPSAGWGLSGGLQWADIPTWDLWQINLDDTDDVHILPQYGGTIGEIRVHNPIPPARIWWIAQRTGGPT